MQQVRSIIRKTLLEMAWSGPKRVAVLRQMQDPDVQRYIAMVDAATSEKELNKLDAYEMIPNLRDRHDVIGDTTLSWALFDLVRGKESELRKEKKAKERAAIDARKAEREAKKDAVSAKIQHAFNNPILMDALNKIGEGFHDNIKKTHITSETNFVQRVFTDGKFSVVKPDKNAPWFERESYHRTEVDASRYFKDKRGIDYYSPEYKINYLMDDWQAKIEYDAERIATSVVGSWKSKMALKLGEVIDRKGGADIGVNERGSAWSNHLTFNFADGSSFYMKTQPVHARSKLGTPFTRFPTTFHNVKFHDGTFMEKPSSEKMQAEFGISDKTATVSTKD
jgi:hypothetical protein